MWLWICLAAGALISFFLLALLWRKVPRGWKWFFYEPFAWLWILLTVLICVVLVLIAGKALGRVYCLG